MKYALRNKAIAQHKAELSFLNSVNSKSENVAELKQLHNNRINALQQQKQNKTDLSPLNDLNKKQYNKPFKVFNCGLSSVKKHVLSGYTA